MEQVIRKALTRLLYLLEVFFEWAYDLLQSLAGQERKTEYNADFMSAREILSPFAKGFCVDGTRSLSIEDSYKNLVVFGQTGSGKSSSVLIPGCLRMMGASSHVINDPSGEIAAKVSGAYERAGYDVRYLNYAKPEMGGYNPLHRIKNATDMQRVSNLIVFSSLGKGGGEQFWNVSAAACLKIFIQIACEQAPEYRTMTNVVRLINTYSFNPTVIDKLVVGCGNQTLLAEYKSFNSYDIKTVTSIIATVKAAIEIFNSPDISMATSYDTVRFEEFRQKPTVLFINNNVANMKYYGLITSLFFTQFFAEIMDRIPASGDLSVFFMIDEASSLNLSGILPVTISNIRKYKAGILQVYQSYHQMSSLFGINDAKAIKENCYSSLYLPGQNIETAKEISATLGQFEYETENGGKKQRLLLTPDEVREMKEGLLVAGNLRGVKLKLTPYYENHHLRGLSELPPYYPTSAMPFDTPPLIPLP